jgi:NAD(P)H dehydrogenase (quinone)
VSTYAVTGATGQLGRLIVEGLLERGVPGTDIVAVVRTPAKAADLGARGVVVREGDYSEPETLPAALTGVDTLLLVSASEPGLRLTQHAAVIKAAVKAGLQRIVYTSILRADTTEIVLAPDHQGTEEILRDSGLSYTILRNGWYIENYTSSLPQFIAAGAIVDAAGDGRVAAAARADYAAAAVAVLLGDGHENTIYELGGTPFTMTQLAATISEASGSPVEHRNVTVPERIEILTSIGLDEGTAAFVAALDEATARGDLDTDPATLTKLIGRPSTALIDVVRAAL